MNNLKKIVTTQVVRFTVQGSGFTVKERLYECGIHPALAKMPSGLAMDLRGNSMLPCKCEERKVSNPEP
ncbi:MAG: hypothetical protein JRE23_13320 [Deltaproteobacteria bacterium]|nr:hypothetical protein [Deltaproteobacteria bacterium]